MEKLTTSVARLRRALSPDCSSLAGLLAGISLLLSPALLSQEPAPSTAPSSSEPSTHPSIEPIRITSPATAASSNRKASYHFDVTSTAKWVDSGIAVAPGDHLDFTATGTLTLADGRSSTPAGLPRGWKDLLRGYPLNSANAAALLMRIGDSEAAVPLAVGSEQHLDPPAAGELFLVANLPEGLGANGTYNVSLTLGSAPAQATSTAPSVDLTKALSPAVFDTIPRRVTDPQGDPGDMVNFALLGTAAQVQKAFTSAGWVAVDKSTNAAVLHGLLATLSREAYLEMPMSTLFLFGRPQDLSYARADPLMVAMVRHHLRVWQTIGTIAGRPLWVGSATHDNGLERDQRDNGVTHRIDPHVDTERDFLEQSFAVTGSLAGAAYLTPSQPVRSAHTATGGSFDSDGRIVVLLLRGQ